MILTMTAYNRPRFLAVVLDSLARCDGVESCRLFASVEPGCPETVALLEAFTGCETSVRVNEQRVGIKENMRLALARGFDEGAGFVCHLEDDFVLAPDAIRYMRWGADRYRDDPDTFAVCAFAQGLPTADRLHAAYRRQWFSPQVWGTWHDRFEEMHATWHDPFEYWGAGHNLNLRMRGERSCVFPYLSRVRHVGWLDGTNTTPESFATDAALAFAGDLALDLEQFRELAPC